MTAGGAWVVAVWHSQMTIAAVDGLLAEVDVGHLNRASEITVAQLVVDRLADRVRCAP